MIFVAMLAMGLAATQVSAQEPEKKKRGGLWGTIKKGVESTTGIDVSREPLFVHPVIGEWRMAVVSCVGDAATGTVALTISASRLVDPGLVGSRCLVSEAHVTGSKTALSQAGNYADPLYDFTKGNTVEVKFNPLGGVPTDAKSLELKFYMGSSQMPENTFELRDCPINWVVAE